MNLHYLNTLSETYPIVSTDILHKNNQSIYDGGSIEHNIESGGLINTQNPAPLTLEQKELQTISDLFVVPETETSNFETSTNIFSEQYTFNIEDGLTGYYRYSFNSHCRRAKKAPKTTQKSDVIVFGDSLGAAERDRIDGLAGNDHINGLACDDTLFGGKGNDTLEGGEGNDSLLGGKPKNDDDPGNDSLLGGNGDDYLTGLDGMDTLIGGANDDALRGGAKNDSLFGESGIDTLLGGAENDFLDGGPGEDSLTGGPGNDIMVGGRGNDTLTGNADQDRFRFNNPNEGIDTIKDFNRSRDLIEIGLGFGLGLNAGQLLQNQFLDITQGAAVGRTIAFFTTKLPVSCSLMLMVVAPLEKHSLQS